MPRLPRSLPQTYFERRADVTRAQSGDKAAMQRLIASHMPLITRDSTRATQRSGSDYDDVIAAGVLGFIEGILRFDMSQEVQPYTYAAHYVRKAVQNDDDNIMGVTRTPRPHGRERASETDEKYELLRFHKVCLDAPLPNQSGGSPQTLLDKIADSSPLPVPEPDPSDLLPRLLALPQFSPADRKLITLHSEGKGHAASARAMGISASLADWRWRALLPRLRSAILFLDPNGDVTGVTA